MITETEFVKKLGYELGEDTLFDREEVFSSFERFVTNKDLLKKAIDLGMFHYDYRHFVDYMKNTLFEEGIKQIVDMTKSAYNKDKNKTENALKNAYNDISKGLASYTQTILVQPSLIDISRFDLFTKLYFLTIGDRIESSLKPYLVFLNNIRAIIVERETTQKTFGSVLDALMNYKDIWRSIYRNNLLDISASQWRNIADHNDYRIVNDSVDVVYGEQQNRQTKTIDKNKMIYVISEIDTILYMNKIAFTLLSVDYYEYMHISDVLNQKNSTTVRDDTISQIVETTHAYGFKVLKIDANVNPWNITLQNLKNEFNRDELIDCVMVLTSIIGKNFIISLIKDGTVEGALLYSGRKLVVLQLP